jgi:DGQHR domain-containing protein
MQDKPASIQDLIRSNQHLAKRQYKERLNAVDNAAVAFENKMWCVLFALKPSHITIGRDIEIQLSTGVYRPDMFALFEGYAVSIQSTWTDQHSFLTEELIRIEDSKRPLQQLLRRDFDNRRLISILAVKNKAALQDSVARRAHNADVKIIDEREIDYYLTLHRSVGIGIHTQFWARVAPSVLTLQEGRVHAIQVQEGRRHKYVFSISPHELLKRVFVSHREITESDGSAIGYQRMLKRSKLKSVAAYARRKHSFPSPVIVSFAKNSNHSFDASSRPRGTGDAPDDTRIGFLKLPTKPGSIYVVDGQHRLFGFSLLDASEKHHIHVIAYEGLQSRQEGEMFVDINLRQTKVPAQLLWELYPDILSDDDSDYFKAVVSQAIENLVASDLKGVVSHTSSGSRGPITFHAICSELIKADLIGRQGAGSVAFIAGQKWDKQGSKLEDILSAYFDALTVLGKKHPEVLKKFFLTNSGFIPLVRELGKICRHENSQHPERMKAAKSSLSSTFQQYLQHLYTFYAQKSSDELDQLRKQRVGSSGFIKTEDEMDDKIRERIHSFPLRSKRTPPELKNECDEFVAEIQKINRSSAATSKDWVFKTFDAEETLKQISKPVKDGATLEKLIKHLHQELIEASGAKSPSNRICAVMGVSAVGEISVLRKLELLRTRSAHRDSAIEPNKRKEAIDFLKSLSDTRSISHYDDLESEDCLKVQINLIARIRSEFLQLFLGKLTPTNP